jgi:hypothetical protein
MHTLHVKAELCVLMYSTFVLFRSAHTNERSNYLPAKEAGSPGIDIQTIYSSAGILNPHALSEAS